MRPRLLPATLLLLLLPFLAAATTLDTIKKRGAIACGVGESFPGFFALDSQGVWHGFDVDFCRALSAAIFGAADHVVFRVATPVARFVQLQSGEVDILSRSVTWTLSREAGQGLEFTGVTFFDGQGFMVRKASNISHAAQLAGAAICTQTGTTTERNLSDWFTAHNLTFTPVVFETADQAIAAYEAQRCDAYTTDRSTLAARLNQVRDPAANIILPDTITTAANGPVVRRDDPQWAAIVRWTLNALISAEAHGITAANVDQIAKESPDPETRRLLGVNGDLGKFMGLENTWAASAIRAVGNYGEMYARNLGGALRVVIPREGTANRLARDGGLLYSPSFE